MESIKLSVINVMAKSWWLILLSGLLFIGLGLCVMLAPVKSFFSMSLLFAATIFVAGIMEMLAIIKNNKNVIGWGWYLAGGIIDTFIGGYLLFYPMITMGLLPVLFGAWMFYRGVVTTLHAISLRNYAIKGWSWLATSGIMIILLSMLIIFNPVIGFINFIVWTGLAFFIFGIFRITLAFELQKLMPLR